MSSQHSGAYQNLSYLFHERHTSECLRDALNSLETHRAAISEGLGDKNKHWNDMSLAEPGSLMTSRLSLRRSVNIRHEKCKPWRMWTCYPHRTRALPGPFVSGGGDVVRLAPFRDVEWKQDIQAGDSLPYCVFPDLSAAPRPPPLAGLAWLGLSSSSRTSAGRKSPEYTNTTLLVRVCVPLIWLTSRLRADVTPTSTAAAKTHSWKMASEILCGCLLAQFESHIFSIGVGEGYDVLEATRIKSHQSSFSRVKDIQGLSLNAEIYATKGFSPKKTDGIIFQPAHRVSVSRVGRAVFGP